MPPPQYKKQSNVHYTTKQFQSLISPIALIMNTAVEKMRSLIFFFLMLGKREEASDSNFQGCSKFNCDTFQSVKERAKMVELPKIAAEFSICVSYCTVPSAIWPIFSGFLIFCRLISRSFRQVK